MCCKAWCGSGVHTLALAWLSAVVQIHVTRAGGGGSYHGVYNSRALVLNQDDTVAQSIGLVIVLRALLQWQARRSLSVPHGAHKIKKVHL
ncbi:hypothetical protein BRN93_22970 [Xanthomonas oryzae pv. oryzae]|nr:hypothetical protein BRN29_19230 [Xanthomonas oryzae pv. oryzae]RBC38644.1 hypothetical protein BRN41_21185 [Xanthomonas oryzae pv. oryzae]RBC68981.1 hypothetical protein BRM99_25580 [Xanthomonas oryzae pv. oryzae]RBD91408.1 hypothetical protein BRM14_17000 [Xanthomonas oryzae pv. oryzae]RBE77882.1 hypothetical protein BRL73_25200 [Xanthomonas oryzae pv. oryzae]